jgi:hypothetical protein
LACFPALKYYLRLTTFTMHFTTTSPRFTTFCTPEYPKTPAKHHPHHAQLNPTQNWVTNRDIGSIIKEYEHTCE